MAFMSFNLWPIWALSKAWQCLLIISCSIDQQYPQHISFPLYYSSGSNSRYWLCAIANKVACYVTDHAGKQSRQHTVNIFWQLWLSCSMMYLSICKDFVNATNLSSAFTMIKTTSTQKYRQLDGTICLIFYSASSFKPSPWPTLVYSECSTGTLKFSWNYKCFSVNSTQK